MRIAVWLLLCLPALAQSALVPPTEFRVVDRPNDAGNGILLTWKESPSDGEGVKYEVFAALSADGPWVKATEIDSMTSYEADNPKTFGFSEDLKHWHTVELESMPDPSDPNASIAFRNDFTFPLFSRVLHILWPARYPYGTRNPYFFRLELVRGNERVVGGTGSAIPRKHLWDFSKTNLFIGSFVFCGLVLFLIRHARKNPNMFIRRIPGLDAVDEAIGRATEMGKAVLYINGLLGMDSISTIASTSILGRLAKRIAQYDSQILVPCQDPVVMSVCQEVVKEAYIDAGRPDAYKPDSVHFLTNDQFSYVAAIDGMMVRDKPAANFYMGYYYAEALLLAETGASTGAIQIAGTDSVTQLPFFIAACDYTLIGEELYAAGAYLSKDPLQLGSLKGQDFGKAVIIVSIVLGTVLATVAVNWKWPFLDFILHWFTTF